MTLKDHEEEVLIPLSHDRRSEGHVELGLSLLEDAELEITPEGVRVRIKRFASFAARLFAAFPSPDDLVDLLERLLESAGIDLSQIDPVSLGTKLWTEVRGYLGQRQE